MPSNFTDALRSTLPHLGALALGTMCSGTDVCAMSLVALLAALAAGVGALGPQVQLRGFQAETAILCISSPSVAFIDVRHLSQPRAYDLVDSKMKHVPSVDILIAGFSCTDVSHMSRHR